MEKGSLVKWKRIIPDSGERRGYREEWKFGTIVQSGRPITIFDGGARDGDRILNILVDGEVWTTRRFGLPHLTEVSS